MLWISESSKQMNNVMWYNQGPLVLNRVSDSILYRKLLFLHTPSHIHQNIFFDYADNTGGFYITDDLRSQGRDAPGFNKHFSLTCSQLHASASFSFLHKHSLTSTAITKIYGEKNCLHWENLHLSVFVCQVKYKCWLNPSNCPPCLRTRGRNETHKQIHLKAFLECSEALLSGFTLPTHV